MSFYYAQHENKDVIIYSFPDWSLILVIEIPWITTGNNMIFMKHEM